MTSWKQSLTIEHYIVYKLYPKHRGQLLNVDQVNEVHDFISFRNPAYFPVIIAFDAKSSPFPAALYTGSSCPSIEPHVWWPSLNSHPINDQFIDLAVQLLTYPPPRLQLNTHLLFFNRRVSLNHWK